MSKKERTLDALEAAAVKLDMRLAKIKERGVDVTHFVFAPLRRSFREWLRDKRCARKGEWLS